MGLSKSAIERIIEEKLKSVSTTTTKKWTRADSISLVAVVVSVVVPLFVYHLGQAKMNDDEHISQLVSEDTKDLRHDVGTIKSDIAWIKGQLEILRPLVEKQVAQNLRNTAKSSAAAPAPGSIDPAIVKSAGLQLLQSGNTKAAAIAVNYISHARARQNGMDFSKLSRCIVGKPGGLIEISGGVLRNCVFDIQGRASYVNATFINCVIKYYGAPTTFKNVTFQNCYFIIVHPTERPLPTEQEFLREALNNPQGFTLNSSG